MNSNIFSFFTTTFSQIENCGITPTGANLMILKCLKKTRNTIGSVEILRQWYDNEWGYSNRVVDLVRYITK